MEPDWTIERAEPLQMTSLRLPVRMKEKLDILSRYLGRSRTETMLILLDRGLEETFRAMKVAIPKKLEGSVLAEQRPGGKLPRARRK